MTKKKIGTVASGRGKYATIYKLMPNGVFLGKNYFSARSEWRKVLNALFVAPPGGDAMFAHFHRSVESKTFSRRAMLGGDGSVVIGCNRFSRVAVRKIARWAGWTRNEIRDHLS